MPGTDLPSVDVVIPVYEPDEKLNKIIEMLNLQTVIPKKIVIMVTLPDGESEESAEDLMFDLIARSRIWIEIHTLTKREFDHGGTRNAGISFCDADIVVCMTQDAVPENERLIEELTAPLAAKNVIVSYARQLPAKNAKAPERYSRKFNYPKKSRVKTKADLEELGIKTYFCSNVCAAYNRELFLSLGGFEQKIIFNEDMVFAGHAMNAGFAVAYAARARVIHSHNLTGGQQFKRNFDLAVSQVQHPEVFGNVPSEGEGIKLVKGTIDYMVRKGRIFGVPGFMLNTACRYAGYRLGRLYKKLPGFIIMRCTSNKEYWRA